MPADALLKMYAHSRNRLAPNVNALDPALYHTFFYDFFDTGLTGAHFATVKDGVVSTPTLLDVVGGAISVATDVNNNDEIYVSSIAENWLFAAGKPLWFEARIALTEINVDDANIIMGLSDTVAANSLLDNGAGPMASYDGAVFFKVDGGVVWQFETSNAGTQVTTASAGAFASDTWYRLGMLFNPGAGTIGTVTPYINGVKGTAHNITLAGLEEMHLLFGAKSGAAAAETLRVDYVKIVQAR